MAGFAQRQPGYIKTADTLLKGLPPSANAAVAQAACNVLLGNVQSAIDLVQAAEVMPSSEQFALLGSSGSSAPPASSSGTAPSSRGLGLGRSTAAPPAPGPTPQQAYAYVYEQSQPLEDGDLLPGVCEYTEQWLAQVSAIGWADARVAGYCNRETSCSIPSGRSLRPRNKLFNT